MINLKDINSEVIGKGTNSIFKISKIWVNIIGGIRLISNKNIDKGKSFDWGKTSS